MTCQDGALESGLQGSREYHQEKSQERCHQDYVTGVLEQAALEDVLVWYIGVGEYHDAVARQGTDIDDDRREAQRGNETCQSELAHRQQRRSQW